MRTSASGWTPARTLCGSRENLRKLKTSLVREREHELNHALPVFTSAMRWRNSSMLSHVQATPIPNQQPDVLYEFL
jgi:hypothetical protein